MEVSEIMTKSPIYVDSKESLHEALIKLQDKDIRHLPVLQKGELVGIISERDIHSVAALAGEKTYSAILQEPVANFMSRSVVTINPSADVSELLDILIEGKFGAVPVVDGHDLKLVGIVSYIDLLKSMRNIVS